MINSMMDIRLDLGFLVRNSAIRSCLVLSMLLLAILATISGLVRRVLTVSFHTDNAYFIESARQFSEVGIPRVLYFPNSVAGLDVFGLTHHFPTVLHGIWVKLFDLTYHEYWFVIYLEMAVALVVCLVLTARIISRFTPISKMLSVAIVVVLMYEPLLQSLFLSARSYQRWSFIFANVAVLCLLGFLSAQSRNRKSGLAFLTGVCAGMAPVSFISVGIPAAAGLVVAFIVELLVIGRSKARPINEKLQLSLLMVIGLLLPIFVVAVYAFVMVGYAQVIDIFNVAVHFGGQSEFVPRDLFHWISRIGYFGSTIFLSPYGPTILGLGIVIVVVNFRRMAIMTEDHRMLVRITGVMLVVWFLLAIFGSTHFYAARLIWLTPLLLGQIATFVKYSNPGSAASQAIVCGGVGAVALQVIHHSLFDAVGSYQLVIHSGAICALALAVALAIAKFPSRALRSRIAIHFPKLLWASVLILAVYGVANFSAVLASQGSIIYSELSRPNGQVTGKAFIEEAKGVVELEMAGTGHALTNLPYGELFPRSVFVQEIHFDNRLYSGATSGPADKVFLFGPGRIFDAYRNPFVGSRIYYRGFNYNLSERIDLPGERFVLIGLPSLGNGAAPIFPVDFVPSDEVQRYIGWISDNSANVRR